MFETYLDHLELVRFKVRQYICVAIVGLGIIDYTHLML